MTTNIPDPPDPYTNRAIVFVYPAIDEYQSSHARHPDTPCTLVLQHNRGSDVLSREVYVTESPKDWDPVIESINLYYEVTGPGTLMVSIHNLSLIQRAAWWWSRRCSLPDPKWSISHVQQDLVNHYNGPAIITAEERFAFNINNASKSLGNDVRSDANYKELDSQFENFVNLWNLVKS